MFIRLLEYAGKLNIFHRIEGIKIVTIREALTHESFRQCSHSLKESVRVEFPF